MNIAVVDGHNDRFRQCLEDTLNDIFIGMRMNTFSNLEDFLCDNRSMGYGILIITQDGIGQETIDAIIEKNEKLYIVYIGILDSKYIDPYKIDYFIRCDNPNLISCLSLDIRHAVKQCYMNKHKFCKCDVSDDTCMMCMNGYRHNGFCCKKMCGQYDKCGECKYKDENYTETKISKGIMLYADIVASSLMFASTLRDPYTKKAFLEYSENVIIAMNRIRNET